jgi:hypothetical protein
MKYNRDKQGLRGCKRLMGYKMEDEGSKISVIRNNMSFPMENIQIYYSSSFLAHCGTGKTNFSASIFDSKPLFTSST